jgi:hypothetical protein
MASSTGIKPRTEALGKIGETFSNAFRTLKEMVKPTNQLIVDGMEPTPPSGASSTPARDPALQPEPMKVTELDALWNQGQFVEMVGKIDNYITNLNQMRFDRMDGATLADWVVQMYAVQHAALGLFNKLGGPAEREAKIELLGLTQRIADVQTRIFRRVEFLDDMADPAMVKDLMSIREIPILGFQQTYRNTMKTPGVHQQREVDAYLVKEAQRFIQRGGDPSALRPVTMEFLKELKSGELVEWAVNVYDVARMAKAPEEGPTPGHTLLSGGVDALGAGSFRVFKDENGEITQVIIGSFSGHFRMGNESHHHLFRHLVAAGVPAEKISYQEGESVSGRSLEMLERVIGKEGVAGQLKAIEEMVAANKWGVEPSGSSAVPGRESVQSIEQRIDDALKQGVLGEAEARSLVDAVERALTTAESAGDPASFREAMALLEKVSSLPGDKVDAKGEKVIQAAAKRWNNHVFGAGVYDAADVLSAPPVGMRRGRIGVQVSPTASDAAIREALSAGADVVRVDAKHGANTISKLTARVRSIAASLGRSVSMEVEVRDPSAVDKQLLESADLVSVTARSTAEVLAIRSIFKGVKRPPAILARIESAEGLAAVEAIAKEANGLILDRAALAKEAGPDKVREAESALAEIGNRLGKPTVMLGGLGTASKERSDALYSAIHSWGADGAWLDVMVGGSQLAPQAIREVNQVIAEAEGV